MFKIYNKSSERMIELQDGSIDLIIAGPPYNIGTKYDTFNDSSTDVEYKHAMTRVFKECHRVLKQDGVLIVESADTVVVGDRYIALAGLLQSICLKMGFYVRARHINMVQSKNGVELLEHDWKSDYSTKKNAHSNCHQFLVFTKTKTKFDFSEGKIFYSNYIPGKNHPCPFPITHSFILDMHFKKGMRVLDPFMGTATIGAEVLKRNGSFIGYELVKSFYDEANIKLNSSQSKVFLKKKLVKMS